jgi:indole-3-glycerol phosphate synthase
MAPPGDFSTGSRSGRVADFLAAMAASSRLRADGVTESPGESRLMARARAAAPARPLELSDTGFDLIAEPKLASPSDGELVPHADSGEAVLRIATSLAGSGCVALSVLTEPSVFAGAVEHLEAVSAAVDLPVMRKDFLVDPIQVVEARAAGASGVLLIARIVKSSLLVEMTDLVIGLGMFALVEVFDESDLESAAAVFDRAVLVGVNARDLATLEVDRRRHARLAPLLPDHLPAVAESGIATAGDAMGAALAGYRLALVGTAVATSGDPAATVRRLIAAGETAVSTGLAR